MSFDLSKLTIQEPSIQDVKLRPISPSKHWMNRACAYRYILSCCPHACELPASPRAEIGTVVHKLLEWSSTRRSQGVTAEEASTKFDELLAAREAKLAESPLTAPIAKLSKSCDVFLKRRHAAIRHAQREPEPPAFSSPRTSTSAHVEQSMTSPDGLIVGTMDAVYRRGDTIYILDKKTGDVCVGDQIKEHYIEQLYLYAGLVDECLGIMPSGLTLVDGDGERWDLDFTPEQIRSTYQAAKDWLTAIKHEISDRSTDITKLAAPRPENCRTCQYRPGCRPYWDASRLNSGGYPNDFCSTVASITTLPLATVIKFAGYDAALSFRIKANELPNHPMVSQLRTGDKVIIANVAPVGRQMETTPQTVVYKDLRP